MSLQAIEVSRNIPISVEWTVPFRNTFFHLGVHNLPPNRARAIMDRLKGVHGAPAGERPAGDSRRSPRGARNVERVQPSSLG